MEGGKWNLLTGEEADDDEDNMDSHDSKASF